ncbi:MAG TPA: RNA polymerase sigma factor [Gemmatimonadaceae bacterium]
MEPTDTQLVRRVLDGDVDAFAPLVDRYHDRLARYAVRMLGDREDAEEALQDTFLRAYRALDRYRDEERFGGWLFRILVNQCRSVVARRQRRAELLAGARWDPPAVAAAPDAEGEGEGEGEGELREELARALAELPAPAREAVLLRYAEELTYEEMASITGSGVSALKMRVQRACARLRSLLLEVDRV